MMDVAGYLLRSEKQVLAVGSRFANKKCPRERYFDISTERNRCQGRLQSVKERVTTCNVLQDPGEGGAVAAASGCRRKGVGV